VIRNKKQLESSFAFVNKPSIGRLNFNFIHNQQSIKDTQFLFTNVTVNDHPTITRQTQKLFQDSYQSHVGVESSVGNLVISNKPETIQGKRLRLNPS